MQSSSSYIRLGVGTNLEKHKYEKKHLCTDSNLSSGLN